MMNLRFSSILPLSYRDELERIVFFNPEQSRFREPLLAAVNRYGVPAIVEDAGRLRLSVPAFRGIQSLYALDDDQDGPEAVLAGVAMFVRETDASMLVLHIAVHQDYAAGGVKADEWLATRLMGGVRDVCLRTRGVTELRVLYPRETRFDLRPRAQID